VKLSARGTSDPDGDHLTYRWWYYKEAGSFQSNIQITDWDKQRASFTVPADAVNEDSIHIICEVMDDGLPQLTRYRRIIITVEP
jgi:hypothetical protein